MGHYCEGCNKDVAHCECPDEWVRGGDLLTKQDHDGLAKAFNDMQAKMRVTAAKGYSGWHDPALCPASRLRAMLREAIIKGDPVDVMNLAMMLNARGERTYVPLEGSEPKRRPKTASKVEPWSETKSMFQKSNVAIGLRRLAVPGGWLVYTTQGSLTFTPDPNHEWE